MAITYATFSVNPPMGIFCFFILYFSLVYFKRVLMQNQHEIIFQCDWLNYYPRGFIIVSVRHS